MPQWGERRRGLVGCARIVRACDRDVDLSDNDIGAACRARYAPSRLEPEAAVKPRELPGRRLDRDAVLGKAISRSKRGGRKVRIPCYK